jgi:hypothetical protein
VELDGFLMPSQLGTFDVIVHPGLPIHHFVNAIRSSSCSLDATIDVGQFS